MVLAVLAARIGARHVHGPDAVEPRYLDDESGGVAGRPVGVVRPGDTAEVAFVLAACHVAGQPVVVQGGRTGMTRAALPRDGELILSLERIAAVEAVDAVAGTMTVGAGCVLATAQTAAAEAGWRLAVDIGARGSCTIGGMIATNAGGHQVLRHGMMRDQVLGLEAVLADGTVISAMNRLLKNNSGYDLKQLFVGAEGTLGVVTRAVLRLRPPAIRRETVLCALGDYAGAVALLGRLDRALPGQLGAFELMWGEFLAAAAALPGASSPFATPPPLAALVEVEGQADGALAAALESCLADGIISDAVVAQSERDHQRLWAVRDAIGPLVETMPLVEPFDVSVALQAIGPLVDQLRAALSAELPGSRPLFFGHIADGNLHVALALADEAQRAVAERIVYDAVGAMDGSVSAEHGIGMLKRAWLGHSRSAEEIALMRRLRATLDPQRILNPGRIFEDLPGAE